jgi:MFS family permease
MAFASVLAVSGFRPLSLSALFHSLGYVGEQVVLGWVVLQRTDSAALVGVAFAVREMPFLVTGLSGGVLADRYDRTWLLRTTGFFMAAATAGLGILVLGPSRGLWPLLLVAFLNGCAHAINQAARQGQVHDLVGPDRLVSGLAILGFAMRVAGLLGSLGTGVLIARLGSGSACFAIAVSYLMSAALLSSARATSQLPAGRSPTLASDTAGVVAFMRGDRTLIVLVALTAAIEVLGFSHQALLPSLARDVLDVGADGLGALTASRSLGGMLATAPFARLGRRSGAWRLFLGTVAVFGTALVLLGLTRTIPWVFLLVALLGATAALSDVFSQSLIQLAVPAGLRGRAGGLWVFAVGSAPIGQMQAGLMAALLGVPIALFLNGGALLVVVAIAWFLPIRRL